MLNYNNSIQWRTEGLKFDAATSTFNWGWYHPVPRASGNVVELHANFL
jgi:hypothetical protein